jgi:hypothetical protein
MPIIQCSTTSFKVELLNAVHDFNSDEIKIALYGPDADIGPGTTEYTTAGEVTGTGYTAGGKTLAAQSIQNSSGSAWVYWDDPSWPGADFFASGAMIYTADKGNKAIMVLNFGNPRVFDSATNSVVFPPANAQYALMRLT